MRYFFILFLFFSTSFASAIKIEFPTEELSSESVLPIFQPRRMVLDRKITLKYRVELGASLSVGLDEPFYFPFYATGLLGFYISEWHSLSVTGTYFSSKKTSVAKKLAAGGKVAGLDEGQSFDVFKSPYPQMTGFLNYQYSPFYGKISLTKQATMNLSIYGYVGPGFVLFNRGDKVPAANIGLGQKLYFSKWFAIRGDFGFYGYYGPAPARIDLGSQANRVEFEDVKDEQKRPIINFVVNVGLVFLI